MEHKVLTPKKVTLLLDDETISIFKQYATEKFGSTNVSNAIRSMAREYEQARIKQIRTAE